MSAQAVTTHAAVPSAPPASAPSESAMAIIAQRRFGYGPQPDLFTSVSVDPIGYVTSQIQDANYKDSSGLNSSTDLLRELYPYHLRIFEAQQNDNGDKTADQDKNKFVRETELQEIAYRIDMASQTTRPMVERLVQFWSEHFCISCEKNDDVHIVGGAYEREAIRPYVLGNFREMLGAVMHHPAMLFYLDNNQSIGPNSTAGKKHNVGLNENLGRELLELHTVGVNGGYNQADVTNAARIITGWGVAPLAKPDGGVFEFSEYHHEPGAFPVMGKLYDQNGEAQGEALLDVLAHHPSTARHIARKLVRHFVGDGAPPALVQTVAQAFQKSGGDLKATTLALVESPASWRTPAKRVLPPYDMIVMAERLIGLRLKPEEVVGFTRLLGQPIWRPRSPNGFPDDDHAWAAPNSMVKRFDWAMSFAGKTSLSEDPRQLASNLFGPGLSPDLNVAINRAASRNEALATLVMSPDLQLR